MYTRIEVLFKDTCIDTQGSNIRAEIETFGFCGITNIRVCQAYIIFGNFSKAELNNIARKLLADTITQDYEISEFGFQNLD